MCNKNSKNSADFTLQTVLTAFVFDATATVFTFGENNVVFVRLTTISIVKIPNFLSILTKLQLFCPTKTHANKALVARKLNFVKEAIGNV